MTRVLYPQDGWSAASAPRAIGEAAIELFITASPSAKSSKTSTCRAPSPPRYPHQLEHLNPPRSGGAQAFSRNKIITRRRSSTSDARDGHFAPYRTCLQHPGQVPDS